MASPPPSWWARRWPWPPPSPRRRRDGWRPEPCWRSWPRWPAGAGWIWLSGVVAARTAARVKQELRGQLADAVARRGPGWLSGQRAGELATLVGRGLDGLDSYFTGYLPQLVLSVTVPVAVLAQLALADWSSAAIVAVTLPLVPVFGMLSAGRPGSASARQWRRLSRLGGHFLDLVTGLATLRAFGRARTQAAAVRRAAEAHRRATMRTLRIAFLSALVLELLAALAVALVAVPIGLRLLAGALDLYTGLLVLFLVPGGVRAAARRRCPVPRQCGGAHRARPGLHHARGPAPRPSRPFRAGTRGGAAGTHRPGDRVPGRHGRVPQRGGAAPVLAADHAGHHAGGDRSQRRRQEHPAALLLGFVPPTEGRMLVDGVDLASLDLAQWRRRLAWVPQRPHLFAASLRDNLRLGHRTHRGGGTRRGGRG